MIRLRLRIDELMRSALERKLPLRLIDSGYLVHCRIKELFGNSTLKPFCLERSTGRWIEVLGYCCNSAEQLAEHARTYADPGVFSSCDWDNFHSKPMPSSWVPHRQLGFAVRACPVVRKSSAGRYHRSGAEVDVFLSRCWEVGDRSVPVDRETVYREWLNQCFERYGGTRMLSMRMKSFKLTRFLRRTQGDGRKSAVVERPDVLLEGRLEVDDGLAFRTLLARGIGRHRAFGMGMLLLKPPESSSC